MTIWPIPEDLLAIARARGAEERFARLHRGILFRAREASEALRQICIHTERLLDERTWHEAARAEVVMHALVNDDITKQTAAELLYRHFVPPTPYFSMIAGQAKHQADDYVRRSIIRFVDESKLLALYRSLDSFLRSPKNTSPSLTELRTCCKELRDNTIGLNGGMIHASGTLKLVKTTFRDCSGHDYQYLLSGVENLSEKVSKMIAQLIPELRIEESGKN